MAKHTPGPWIVYGCRQKLGDEDCQRVGPDGFPIVFVPIGRTPKEFSGALADAHLIAAAPDLLDACSSVWMALADTDVPSLRLLADQVRAAVAKARAEIWYLQQGVDHAEVS